MRATVTLDPDVQALLKRAMREQDRSFKQTLNDAVRAGLRKPARFSRWWASCAWPRAAASWPGRCPPRTP
jgi:hypothetical protein